MFCRKAINVQSAAERPAGKRNEVLPVVAGFYAAGVIVDDPKARETGVLGAEALLDGLIVQVALHDPEVSADRACEIAVSFAAVSLAT